MIILSPFIIEYLVVFIIMAVHFECLDLLNYVSKPSRFFVTF